LKLTTNRFATAILTAGLIAGSVNAQTLKTPAASPFQSIKQAFALSDITVEYSRPGAKGRVIYGDLVPYGKIWRTGANAATKITLGEDVKVEGNDLKAGTYAVYTIPKKDTWEILFYRDLTLGGNVKEYKTENEVLRIKVKPQPMAEHVENFTFEFTDLKPTSMNIGMIWEKTRVAFNVTGEIDAAVMKNIEKTMANDTRPYYQAANYYYENDKDLKQALAWVDKAIENNPKGYFIMTLKAKIQLKMKDTKGAIETANKALTLSREDGDDSFVKINEKILADAKK
jgi:tetratricopeptide (TPR) repeat protein